MNKRTITISIIILILTSIYIFRYMTVNVNTPKKLNVITHKSGDSIDFENTTVTVKNESSDTPIDNMFSHVSSSNVHKYIKVSITFKNNGQKELDLKPFFDNEDLVIGNKLRTMSFKDDNEKNMKVLPDENKTYVKYSFINKDEIKYKTSYIIIPTLKPLGFISEEEQKEILINRHIWPIIIN
ncbi:hypothetical protein [Bacillus sp. 3G2]|uniref:hypothetical protein n=1 Tax=Bacillus sp. 3G2 TaxID=3375707 RepID=UPI00378700FF